MSEAMQTLDRTESQAVAWPQTPPRSRLSEATEWLRLEATSLSGPRGWRSLIGPTVFALAGISLLVYDHLNKRMTEGIFWLTLILIVTVFARMLETNRKQRLALEEYNLDALSDRTTGLGSRLKLQEDIESAMATPGDTRVLVLFELDGLQSYNDLYGHAAGDELLRWTAARLVDAVTPLGGSAYRFEGSRLGALVPVSQQQLGEIILAATSSLQADRREISIGRAHGEVVVPDEAENPEVAFQIAGQRLAANKQRQHRSARRQAHAVLIAAFSARRPELRDHLRVVAYRAISLARRLGADREQIDDIALAAELQDVGLLTVPEAVLEKQSPLSESERAMIHRHPLEGERMISAAPGLVPVAHLVRSSYERFDGSGYPDGLTGDAIPLGSRIIAVSVAFAAMTSNRPYREASSAEEALTELRRCAGSQFDPQVVEALAADLAEEAETPPVPASPAA